MDESLLYSSPHPRCGERLLYGQFSGGGGAVMRGNLLYNNGNLYSARQQNNICYSKLNSEQRILFKLLIASIVIHSITSPAFIFMTLHCLLTKRLVYPCDGLRIIGRYHTNLILHKKLQHFALCDSAWVSRMPPAFGTTQIKNISISFPCFLVTPLSPLIQHFHMRKTLSLKTHEVFYECTHLLVLLRCSLVNNKKLFLVKLI